MMELQGATVASRMNQASMPSKQFIADGVGFVELMECFGSDLTVVNAARVSFYKESAFEDTLVDGVPTQRVTDRDAKLIQFLAAHKHITPFFHPQLRFRIKMPIFVAREWWRSTIGFSRNEVSRRYVDDMPDFFIPDGLRQRDKNLKQGSKSEFIANNEKMVADMQNYIGKTQAYYQELLDQGVAPEQARMILPQSMYTEFIETASIAGYARLVGLRTDPTAQKEIRDYAHLVSCLVEPRFPVSWKALMVANGV